LPSEGYLYLILIFHYYLKFCSFYPASYQQPYNFLITYIGDVYQIFMNCWTSQLDLILFFLYRIAIWKNKNNTKGKARVTHTSKVPRVLGSFQTISQYLHTYAFFNLADQIRVEIYNLRHLRTHQVIYKILSSCKIYN